MVMKGDGRSIVVVTVVLVAAMVVMITTGCLSSMNELICFLGDDHFLP